METRSVGDLTVSTVGLGCNNFGARVGRRRSEAVVHEALDSGINFFDTADVYGAGLSEEYLGRALAGRRHEVIIATKFGWKLDGDYEGGASARWIGRAVEDSLRRLGTDYIDLYQQHIPDTGDTDGGDARGTARPRPGRQGCARSVVPTSRRGRSMIPRWWRRRRASLVS